MELEELQKAWKELNERVNQNELVHQQQIIEMLSRQKESCLQRKRRILFPFGNDLTDLDGFYLSKRTISFLAGYIWNLALCFDS